MSISGVGSSTGFDVSKMASQFFKKTDTNGDGSVDKAEFTKSLTSMGMSEADASKKFDSLDKNKTGKISESDIEADMKSMQDAKKGDGPPSGKTSGSGSKGTSSTSSTSKTYDKADTNKDGKVSAEEQLVYDLKKLQEAQAKAAKASGTSKVSGENSQSISSNQSSQIGQNIDVTA